MLSLTLSISLLIAQGPSSNSLLGTWHGTSICMDKKVDTACKDEIVVYDVDTVGVKAKGNVMMHAYKIVNKEKDWMGDQELTHDAKSDTWWGDYTGRRGAIRWRFAVTGPEMNGTLVELPSMRMIRKVEVKR